MAKGSRRRRLASGARAVGRFTVKGAKGSLAAGAAGVATYFLSKELSKRVEMAQKHPVATQIAFGAAGHFLKRKYESIGAGMIGGAAAMTAMAFDLNRTKPTGAETSALTSPRDIQALTAPSDIGSPADALDNVLDTTAVEDGVYGDSAALDFGDASSLGM